MDRLDRYSVVNDTDVFDMDEDSILAQCETPKDARIVANAMNFMDGFAKDGVVRFCKPEDPRPYMVTRRDMFAAAVLTGLAANPERTDIPWGHEADACMEAADAMIATLDDDVRLINSVLRVKAAKLSKGTP